MHAFYGPSDPEYGSWAKVPVRMIDVYAKMLPRLEAERELAAINQGHAVVERPLDTQSHGTYMRELRKRAAGPDAPRPRRVSVETLAAFGIPVHREGQKEQAA